MSITEDSYELVRDNYIRLNYNPLWMHWVPCHTMRNICKLDTGVRSYQITSLCT